LLIFPNSLDKDYYLIAMPANAHPAPPPDHIVFIGQPYSFRASEATLDSKGNMKLTLSYPKSLRGNMPAESVRIFRWTGLEWIAVANPSYSSPDAPMPSVTVATKKFATYILGYTVNQLYLPIIIGN